MNKRFATLSSAILLAFGLDLTLVTAGAHAADAPAIDPAEAVRQLMDFAEAQYPAYFPSHPATLTAQPFAYRHYGETGVYLGVATQQNSPYTYGGVYVLGGPFGGAPVFVGHLTNFIKPVTDYSVTFSADRVPVLQGGQAQLQATLVRRQGFNEPVHITLDNLPAGVTSNAVTIPAGATNATLTLTAAPGAPHSLPTIARLRTTQGNNVLQQALTVTVRGAPGVVDTSFNGGVNITAVGAGEDYANGVAVQADGKVLVVGSSAQGGTFVSIVRYLRDGGLDTTFGNQGRVITPVGTRNDVATAVTVQQDGKILVAGSSEQATTGLDFLLLRYNSDGSLDQGFGNGGKVVTELGSASDRAWAMAVQADGKIILAGESNVGAVSGVDFALARYNSNGTLDATFGNGGKVLTPIQTFTGRDSVYGLALPIIDGEQRILAVGGEGDFQAARYRPNGTLDTTFGTDGKIDGLFNSSIGSARGVVLLPDGRAVLAGAIHNDFAAVQLTQAGTLDATFGTGGKFVKGVAPSNWDIATAVVRQADGKLVLGGWAYTGNSSSGDFAALRLTAAGALDNTFGTNGVVTVATAPGTKNDLAHALILQADDRVPTVRAIQAGEANDANHDYALLRLWL